MKNYILDEIVNNSIKLMKCITIKENYNEFEKAFNIVKENLSNYNIREIRVNNYNNLVISNTLDHNLDIIFCAHMDVVPSDKYEGIIKDNKIYGRGAFDMKSNLSVIMSLFKNNKTDKKIAFIITSDEEIGGYCCKEILKEYSSKLAVIPDAGSDFNLIVEEKGLLQVEIKTKGVTAHASEPFKGENAILKSLDIYNKLIKLYPLPKNDSDFITSINLSKLIGGDAINTVADTCTMILDIRFTNDLNKTLLLDYIKKIAKYSTVNVLDYGPTFYVDKNNPIISKFICDSKKILNKNVKIGRCVATSDAIYFSEKNIPTILINPKGNYWHNPGEYVEIDSLYTLYLLFKTLF